MDYSTVDTKTLKEIAEHWRQEFHFTRKTDSTDVKFFDDANNRIPSAGKKKELDEIEKRVIIIAAELNKRVG